MYDEPIYEDGEERAYSSGFADFLLDEGMSANDAIAFAVDFQEHLDAARESGDWNEFHEYLEEIEDILEDEYGIDLDDYKEI